MLLGAARAARILPVHLFHGEHVANFGILVRLGRAECFAINHADATLEASL